MESNFKDLRTEMESNIKDLRAEMEDNFKDLRTEMKALGTELKGDMKLLEQSMAALQNKIVLQLGGLMVTLTFLLLAVGPFYIRWVLSLVAS